MKSKFADLHIHTKYSDGTYRVPEVFRIAKNLKFSAISITDHDSTDSYKEAAKLSRNYGIEIIPGVELSCEYGELDIHILGYFFDPENKEMISYLENFRLARAERAKQMTELMQADGINVSYEDVLKISPQGTIARPHIAQLLVEKGYAHSIQDAFVKYIGGNSKYYVNKFKITPKDAIDLVHRSGGLAFAAHPGYLKYDSTVLEMLVKSGLDGLETMHSSYDEETITFLESAASDKNLLKSGGSDCHGHRKMGKKLIGQYFVPYSYIEAMKEKLSGVRK